MINFLISIIATVFLAIYGFYTGSIQKMWKTAINGICLLFRIERRKEKSIEVSQEVAMLFPQIKKAKISKENTEKVSSISYIGISLIVVATVGLLLNMAVVNDEAISQWLSSWMPIKVATVKVYWTSAMFTIATSGVSIWFNQWKKGRDYRKAQSRKKLYEAAKKELTEQELIDIINSKVEGKM